jgi:hypothetical protein
MVSDLDKELKNASRVALVIAIEKNKARRNIGFFCALVSLALIYWKDWNKWTLLMPAIFTLCAVLGHSNIILFNRELKRRASEEQPSENSENTVANEGDNLIAEDNPDSIDWVAARIQQIEQKMNKPLREKEKEPLLEELSSLRSVLDTRQHNREVEVEKIRLKFQEQLKEHKLYRGEQEILPSFQKWRTFSGNSKLERTEALENYIDYLEKKFEEEKT